MNEELLTDTQKETIAEAYMFKLLEGIRSITFEPVTIDISKMVENDIKTYIEDEGLFSFLDKDVIGEILTEKITKALN